jgi:Na+-transporting methylmalonyl-CoA/oxaloacetate decarboxylase gamma subunit
VCAIPQLVRRSIAEIDEQVEEPETVTFFETDLSAREQRLYIALAIAIGLNLLVLACGVTFVVLTWKR